MSDYEKSRHEITFYTYPKFIFCWPLIVLGYVFWFLSGDSNGEVLAWIWGITLLVVMVTLGFDLNRNYTVFWVVLIAMFWFLVIWLRDAKQVQVFSRIYKLFADLDPVYSPSLGLMISIAGTILYIIMWIWTRLNSKWRITHNEFEHYQFGRMDDSLARGAKRVSTRYPDFFELLLCLAGELIIFDASGRRELRRIPHVPLLPVVRKRIDRILETTSITSSQMEDEGYDDAGDSGGISEEEGHL